MKKFNDLKDSEKKELLKFPAYITLLALNTHGHLYAKEKKEATKFTHIKTFTCNPLLSDFYVSADQEFLQTVETIDAHLPENAEERKEIH